MTHEEFEAELYKLQNTCRRWHVGGYGNYALAVDGMHARLLDAYDQQQAAIQALLVAVNALMIDGHYIECPAATQGHEYMPQNETVRHCELLQKAIAKTETGKQ